jgi:hypothetical protein
MSEDAKQVVVLGKPLACPVCANVRFRTGEAMLNTPVATLLGIDWAKPSATTHVCDECGHVLWFVEK